MRSSRMKDCFPILRAFSIMRCSGAVKNPASRGSESMISGTRMSSTRQKNIILKSRKPKLPLSVLIVWVFCFCLFVLREILILKIPFLVYGIFSIYAVHILSSIQQIVSIKLCYFFIDYRYKEDYALVDFSLN